MKKLISLVLAIVLCFYIPFFVAAIECKNTNIKNNIEAQNIVNAANYAESFIETIYK